MKKEFMNEAIKEARKALEIGEIPVGAVVVLNNEIISSGFNQRIKENDVTMHAELIAIKKACEVIGDWRLNECELYTTMEPCLMCLGTIVESRISKVYCGVENNKYHNINKAIYENENIVVDIGIMNEEIDEILKKFFNQMRNKK